MVIEQIHDTDAELLLECSDHALGYHAFVALYSTARGPALGGIRRYAYLDRAAAVDDAIALARSMAHKSALADLPFGGGKSVIWDTGRAPREALYLAHARVIEELDGRYIGAGDLGTTREDVATMRRLTRFVAGHTEPAQWTARGVVRGIEAAAMHLWRSADLAGCTIAVQGCGNVGAHVARELHDAGASLLVADPDPARVHRITMRYRASAVDPAGLLETTADILAPCAVGGVLDHAVIPRLQATVVAGAANNQLQGRRAADLLARRGILYLPDYLINAGGLMTAGVDLLGWSLNELERRVDGVFHETLRILEEAARKHTTPLAVADRIAFGRLREPASDLPV